MSAFNDFNQNANNLENHLSPAPSIELSLSPFEKPMEVDLEKFFEFSFDLAEDLLDLEAQFRSRHQICADRCSLARTSKLA